MRLKADEKPFCPLTDGLRAILNYQRRENIEGYDFILTFTKTTVFNEQFYQLSIGNNEGDPKLLPPQMVERIKIAFHTLDSWPSFMGNCLQFVGKI